MKKILAFGLSAAMLVSSASSVFAADIMSSDSFEMNYGYQMMTPDQTMTEEIQILSDGSNASASMSMTVDDGVDTISVELPQYVLATPDSVYFNVGVFLDAIESATGEDISAMAEAYGVPTGWLKVAPIHLDAIELPVADISFPEIDEAMLTDLQDALGKLVRIEVENDDISYVIDNGTIADAAASLDSFKENHLGFVGEILTAVQESIANAGSMDIKPAFREYLDAAAAGFAEATPSLSEDQAVAAVDTMVDIAVSQMAGQVAAAVQSVDVVEMWNSTSIADVLNSLIGDTQFEVKVSFDGEKGVIEVTVNGETIKGTIESVENQVVVTLYDGENVAMVETVSILDNGYSVVATDAEGNEMVSFEMTVEQSDEGVGSAFSMYVVDELQCDGYFELLPYEGTLEVPENAADVLEIVKDAVAAAVSGAANAE